MKGLTTTFNFRNKEQRSEFKKLVDLMDAGTQESICELVEEFNTDHGLRKKVAKRLAERDGLTNTNGDKKGEKK